MKQDFSKDNREVFGQHLNLIRFEGQLFILFGILAIVLPFIFSSQAETILGFLLLVGGLQQIYRTVITWGVESSLMALFNALIRCAVGSGLILNPVMNTLALTVTVSIYLILSGFTKFFVGCTFQGKERFFLILYSITSFALGLLAIFMISSITTRYLAGFVGIDLLFFGALAVAYATTLAKK